MRCLESIFLRKFHSVKSLWINNSHNIAMLPNLYHCFQFTTFSFSSWTSARASEWSPWDLPGVFCGLYLLWFWEVLIKCICHTLYVNFSLAAFTGLTAPLTLQDDIRDTTVGTLLFICRIKKDHLVSHCSFKIFSSASFPLSKSDDCRTQERKFLKDQ